MPISVKLYKAEYTDKDKISKFLIENHGHKGDEGYWEKLFLHNWSNKNYYGYCLKTDDMNIVGYFGLIFSEKNKYDNFGYANITSWCVNKKYRKYSLKLLDAAMSETDYILTSHTTTDEILKIYLFKKWQILDTSYCYFFFGFFPSFRKLKIYGSKDKEFNFKNKNNFQIYKDHKNYEYINLIINYNSDEIYIMGKRKKGLRYFYYFDLIYISNIDFFNENISIITKLIKNKLKVSYIRIDSRFCKKIYFNIFYLKKKYVGFKKIIFCKDNKNIEFQRINNIYSEIFLLNL